MKCYICGHDIEPWHETIFLKDPYESPLFFPIDLQTDDRYTPPGLTIMRRVNEYFFVHRNNDGCGMPLRTYHNCILKMIRNLRYFSKTLTKHKVNVISQLIQEADIPKTMKVKQELSKCLYKYRFR